MTRRPSRIYRALLRLLPGELRASFGRDMEQMYGDRLRDADGALERGIVRADAVRDLVFQSGAEWMSRARDAMEQSLKGGMGMDGWVQDFRYGARSLRKRPGFTIAAVSTLALGIAATVSMFGVVNTVLLEPLPYPDSDDLVVLWSEDTRTGDRSRAVDHPDVRAIQSAVPGFSVAGYAGTRPTLTGFDNPEVIFGARVTDGLIGLMGLQPAMGRDLRAEDAIFGGPTVAVISHSFWTERLAADPEAIGRTVVLNGEAWEIVGVGPPDFDFPEGSEIWLPRRHEIDGCGHGCRIMNVIGRVDAGTSIADVRTRLDATAMRLAEEYPNSHRDGGFDVESLLGYEVSDVRTALWVLLGAVVMVLLIACANVANLVLVRSNARREEVALRATLGASRLRIIRQLLTESVILATASGAIGVALAWLGTAALVALAPDSLPRLDTPTLDATVLVFALGLVFAVTAMFGTLPALHASDVRSAGRAGRGTDGRRHSERSRSALLVGEVALSLTLLLGTGLLVRTLGELRAVKLGFDTESIERFRVSVPETRYDSLEINPFLEQIEQVLTAIPGVRAAGWGFGVPLASGNITTTVELLDRPDVPPADQPGLAIRPSSIGFLDATGTRLLRGRWFNEGDRYGGAGVAVINQATVRTHYPDGDPIGLRLKANVSWSFEDTPEMTIVGVVEDVVRSSPRETPSPAVYVPNAQFAANTGYISLRLEPGLATAIPQARQAIADLDPNLAIWSVTTMEEVVADASGETVFYATLLTIFSIVALLLAAVGLYGVVAYSVTRRTREIGIRMALGAASDVVTSMVVREGIRPVLTGVGVGLASSWLVGRAISSMLFGVTPQDPVTIVGATGALLLVTIAATVIPARRASRVQPSSALRAD